MAQLPTYTPEGKAALLKASAKKKPGHVDLCTLLLALISSPKNDAAKLLRRCNVTERKVRQAIGLARGAQPPAKYHPVYGVSDETGELFRQANDLAHAFNKGTVSTGILLAAILRLPKSKAGNALVGFLDLDPAHLCGNVRTLCANQRFVTA